MVVRREWRRRCVDPWDGRSLCMEVVLSACTHSWQGRVRQPGMEGARLTTAALSSNFAARALVACTSDMLLSTTTNDADEVCAEMLVDYEMQHARRRKRGCLFRHSRETAFERPICVRTVSHNLLPLLQRFAMLWNENTSRLARLRVRSRGELLARGRWKFPFPAFWLVPSWTLY